MKNSFHRCLKELNRNSQTSNSNVRVLKKALGVKENVINCI